MKGRVVLRRIGADHLLVPVSGAAARENCVFPLNATGEFIWAGLAQGQSLAAVAQSLSRTFDVPAESALADCREYADELVAQQLLEGVAP
jgi:hypothetical protein